jgi:hypothetical protein
MAKAKKATKAKTAKKAVKVKTQAERLMEVAKAKGGQSGSKFSEAMARITMARNARKQTRMG